MDVDWATNAVKEEQLPLEETDDNPYGFKITNIVSLRDADGITRDADGSCTECVSGDCPVEVKQENSAVVKEEPDDVCCVISLLWQAVLFLRRYEPVRRTGKSDDWLTFFARIIRFTVQKFQLF